MSIVCLHGWFTFQINECQRQQTAVLKFLLNSIVCCRTPEELDVGRFLMCASWVAEAPPERTTHHQSKEEQTCWKMSAVMSFTGGNWQSFMGELIMWRCQVIVKQNFISFPSTAWLGKSSLWNMIRLNFHITNFGFYCLKAFVISVHMHSLCICLVHVPSFLRRYERKLLRPKSQLEVWS